MSDLNKASNLKTEWDDSRLGWLGCAWCDKFGPKTLQKLQAKFGEKNGGAAWQISHQELLDLGIAQTAADYFCHWRADIRPEDLKLKLARDSIDFFLPWDEQFPKMLKNSSCPPGALFWRGAPWEPRPWIAVVGTRKMSAYGQKSTQAIVHDLVDMGAGIVSGLALGIDACAHQSALDAGGLTVAVLGSGLDDRTIYPASNKNLADRILLSQGALISEFPPETKPFRGHFPQRNRIIAALTQATLVVEAGEQSGSVLTAKLALDENREVFAVPGPINNPGSFGTHELLKQGAQLCTCAQDILREIKNMTEQAVPSRLLTQKEKRILDLCRTPVHIDELIRLLNYSPAATAATCTSLEMMDALQETDNQYWEMTNKGRKMLISSQNQADTFDSI